MMYHLLFILYTFVPHVPLFFLLFALFSLFIDFLVIILYSLGWVNTETKTIKAHVILKPSTNMNKWICVINVND